LGGEDFTRAGAADGLPALEFPDSFPKKFVGPFQDFQFFVEPKDPVEGPGHLEEQKLLFTEPFGFSLFPKVPGARQGPERFESLKDRLGDRKFTLEAVGVGQRPPDRRRIRS